MPAIVGYLDGLIRPRASIQAANGARLNVLIDTGFNSGLFVGDRTAKRIGVNLLPYWRDVPVAGGSLVQVQEGLVDVDWISSTSGTPQRTAQVLVYSPEPHIRRGEPEGLLGMLLIAPDKLIIDCLNSDVRITT